MAKPSGHALLDRFDRLAARRNVRLVLGVLGVESGLLLLALRGRIRDGGLGILAVLLVLDLRCLIIKLQLKGGWSFFRKPTYLPLFPPNVSQDIFCEKCCKLSRRLKKKLLRYSREQAFQNSPTNPRLPPWVD